MLGVAGGAWVDAVSALSAQAGLRAGDVLLAINLKPTLSTEEVNMAVRERPRPFSIWNPSSRWTARRSITRSRMRKQWHWGT